MMNLLRILTLFFFSLLLVNCRTLLPEKKLEAKPAPVSAKKTLEKIKQSANKKDFAQTIKELETFVSHNKHNELAFNGYVFMAQLYKKKGQLPLACQTYKKALQLPFSHSLQKETVFSLARCLIQQKKKKKAWETLEKHIQNRDYPLSVKHQAARFQWNLIKQEKGRQGQDWRLKALSLLTLTAKTKQEKTKWEKVGESFLNSLNYEEISALAGSNGDYGFFEGRVLFKAGEKNWKRKRLKKSRYFFNKALSAPLTPSLEEKIRRYLKILQAHFKVNPYLIGVILPLSGHRRALGEKALRGLYMGLGLEKDSPWQMVVMDSKDHPDVVKANMEKLLYDHHIIAVVGGLSGETAEVMAELANEFSLPCILLSQKNKLTENREAVFQNAQTSESLVNHLVKDIGKFLKFKKLAVLHPEDSYGREYSHLFSKVFAQTGGRITKKVSYTIDEVDFKASLRELFELNGREEEYKKLKEEYMKKHPNLSARSRKLRPEYLLEPKKDFYGIFIPDSVETLKKITAYLKYFNIGDLYILGTNLWKPQHLLSLPKDFPLLFINTPQMTQKALHASPFYISYVKSFKSAPGFFERQSYNAAHALALVLKEGSKTRSQVAAELTKLKTIPGAFHPIRLSENRVFTYPLKTYILSDGKVKELNTKTALPLLQ